jgi:hypothetical protein|tara:strand:- start:359 stop:628 length:270 start_codon:yes stop_codon:yes gene_type:complete
MSITVNKGQVLTNDMFNAIQLEGQQALAYLPAEDKVNLALSLTAAPIIDNKDTVKQMALDLQAKLQEANQLIASLNASGANVNATTTNP